MATTPDIVRELADRAAIIDTLVRLFVATDRRDWAAVQSCFADSVLFDMTSLGGGEPQTLSPVQITAGWEEGLRTIESLHHQVGNFLVNVTGEQAAAFCYGIAFHYRRVASGRNTRTFVGTYDARLVRQPAGGWLIDQFRFNLKFLDGNPELHIELGRMPQQS